jgi:hypothetical protein
MHPQTNDVHNCTPYDAEAIGMGPGTVPSPFTLTMHQAIVRRNILDERVDYACTKSLDATDCTNVMTMHGEQRAYRMT